MIKKFCEIFEDDTKNVERVSSNEYLEKGIIAIVDQGKKDIVGYTNNENYKILNCNAENSYVANSKDKGNYNQTGHVECCSVLYLKDSIQ